MWVVWFGVAVRLRVAACGCVAVWLLGCVAACGCCCAAACGCVWLCVAVWLCVWLVRAGAADLKFVSSGASHDASLPYLAVFGGSSVRSCSTVSWLNKNRMALNPLLFRNSMYHATAYGRDARAVRGVCRESCGVQPACSRAAAMRSALLCLSRPRGGPERPSLPNPAQQRDALVAHTHGESHEGTHWRRPGKHQHHELGSAAAASAARHDRGEAGAHN
jgi:hypothetical protein